MEVKTSSIVLPITRRLFEVVILVSVIWLSLLGASLWVATINSWSFIYVAPVMVSLLLLLTYLYFKKYVSQKQILKIDFLNETIKLNETSFSFKEVKYYKSELINGFGLMNPNSVMYVTIGVDDTLTVKLDDATVNRLIDSTQLVLLETLPEKTSLTDEEKQSFQGWIQRIQIRKQ